METDAQWFLKVDDDTYVDILLAAKILQRIKSGQENLFVASSFENDGVVQRTGKWAEHVFQEDSYPPFPHGAGHAVTRDLATYVAMKKNVLFEYQGEDTSMGIWISNCPFHVKFISTPYFEGHNGNCTDTSRAVIGHDITPETMEHCVQSRGIRLLRDTSALGFRV